MMTDKEVIKTSAGHVFYLSVNGVWLVDYVTPQFIEFPSASLSGKP